MQLNKGCLYFYPNIFKFIQSCFIYILSNRQAPFVSVFALFCLCYCLPDMITRQDVFNAELISLNTYSTPQCTLVRLNILSFADSFLFLDPRLGFIHPPVKSKPRLSTTANRYLDWQYFVYFFFKFIFIAFEATNKSYFQLTHLNLQRMLHVLREKNVFCNRSK